jgi:hypothetical protein
MTGEPPETRDGPDDKRNDQTRKVRSDSRRDQRRNWLTGILTGLISGALVSFYLTATGQATWTAIHNGLSRPSCANPQWLLQVSDSVIFANAYYVQRDQVPGYGFLHAASNTVDGSLSTSWLQFWPSPSTHLGEKASSDYITWAFPQSYDVRLICIVDGWTEDTHTYKATLPIGTATVYVTNSSSEAPSVGSPAPSGMCASQTPDFKDYMQRNGDVGFAYQWQPITFHCVTDNIVLRIDSVSKNSEAFREPFLVESSMYGLQGPLTGLSEVRFYYCPALLCWLPTS